MVTNVIRPVATTGAPAPAGHYSQGMIAGRQLFISGQLPVPATGTPDRDAPFEAQATVAIANMLAVLKAAGGEPHHLIKVTAYIVGIENWPRFNQVYAAMLGEVRPARSVVPVPELHYGFLVEVDAVAMLDDASSTVPAR